MINEAQALAVLTASEGAKDNLVSLAVPNSLLGKSRGKNASGFSFGIVQLDIGNNGEAKKAFAEILKLGVASGIIPQQQANDWGRFAVQRPDLAFPNDYKQARSGLNKTVFAPDSKVAKKVDAIIAAHQSAHLGSAVVPQVNAFLANHKTGVFADVNASHSLAIAALVSAQNRTGGLGRCADALKGNAAPSLDDLKKAWARQIGRPGPNDWKLVEAGAKKL